MRIGAGRFRNALLPPAGPGVRPVPGRLRQSLFTRLLPRLADARILDLCAGVGGLGLEALSRGAAQVVLVEADRRAASALERWIDDRRLRAQALVVRADARRGGWPAGPYDLVFADPPFPMWGGATGRRPAPGPAPDDTDDAPGPEEDERAEGREERPSARGARRGRGRRPDPPGAPEPGGEGAREVLARAVEALAPGGIVVVKLPATAPSMEDPRWRVLDRRAQGDVGYAILGRP